MNLFNNVPAHGPPRQRRSLSEANESPMEVIDQIRGRRVRAKLTVRRGRISAKNRDCRFYCYNWKRFFRFICNFLKKLSGRRAMNKQRAIRHGIFTSSDKKKKKIHDLTDKQWFLNRRLTFFSVSLLFFHRNLGMIWYIHEATLSIIIGARYYFLVEGNYSHRKRWRRKKLLNTVYV